MEPTEVESHSKTIQTQKDEKGKGSSQVSQEKENQEKQSQEKENQETENREKENQERENQEKEENEREKQEQEQAAQEKEKQHKEQERRQEMQKQEKKNKAESEQEMDNQEYGEMRKSSQTKRPSRQLLEAQESERIQDSQGKKRDAEGEFSQRPTQRVRSRRARKQERVEAPRDASEKRRNHESVRLGLAVELILSPEEQSEESRAYAASQQVDGIPIPKTYKEAVQHPIYGTQWQEAIHNEISTLIKFGTWKIVRRRDVIDQGFNISTTRWVFDLKIGPDGRVERFKARLVVRGFIQKEGEDFQATFAPVFRLDSLRILMAIAGQYDLKAHLIDGTNAFVGSDLDKPNYITKFEGIEDFNPETADGDYVLELVKSLYGCDHQLTCGTAKSRIS